MANAVRLASITCVLLLFVIPGQGLRQSLELDGILIDEHAADETPTAVLETAVQTQLINDPFASGFKKLAPMLKPAQGSGCGLKGWTGMYFLNGIVRVAKLQVFQMSVSFEVEDDLKKMASSSGLEAALGDHSISEFREMMCKANFQLAFPDACSFFEPMNLAGVCPVLAVGQTASAVGTTVGQTASAVGTTVANLVPDAINDPFDTWGLLGHMGIRGSEGSGCGLTGWTKSYFAMGIVKVAELHIGQTKTTFTCNSQDLTRQLKMSGANDEDSLCGEHATEDFREKMCASPQLQQIFPRACAFFSPGNLRLVCPVLLAGQAAGAAGHALTSAKDAMSDWWKARKGGEQTTSS